MAHTTTRPHGIAAAGRRFDSRRVYVALLFAPLFYALVRHAPAAAFFGLVTIAALIAVAEFYRLHFRSPHTVFAGQAVGFAATAVLLAMLQWPGFVPERAVVLLMVIAALTACLVTQRNTDQGLIDPAILVFGPLYVGLTLGHLLLTRALEGGEFLVFFVVLVTWAGDTGAYYAGISLGRRKLMPTVSPNKTVEGLVGGLVLAVAAAGAGGAWFLPSFTLADCVATGLLLTVAGVAGDLAESALKRGAGVKDSGSLLPGHGGVLDRLDSLLFTAPVFYYYVLLVKGT